MSEGGRANSAGAVDIEKAPSRIDANPEDRVLRALSESFPRAVTDGKKVRPGLIRARIDRSGTLLRLPDAQGPARRSSTSP